ncbi:MAG: LptF/LptG family permease [Calditrichaeota bacterium]|nr:LptF/LptG family permease [Calditrichota bacterium]MCB9366038.1 LptF/LptG family permease [Calditrichota bacterium]MCB9391836.1 LptF/LptG family permease [Calditrichota bacterium]
MTLLDRYIVSAFARSFFFAMIAAAVIFVTIDLVEHLDKFVDAQVGFDLISRYYLLYIPFIVYLTIPVGVLLATLFTIGGFVYRNELTAMQASGVSLWRILVLLLLVVAPLAGGVWVLGENVVPRINFERKELYRVEVRKGKGSASSRQGRIYLQTSPTEFLKMESYDPKLRTGYQVQLQLVENGRVVTQINADSLSYREGLWTLLNAERTDFMDRSVSMNRIESLARPDFQFTPDDLIRVNIEPDEMSYKDIQSLINRLQAAGIRGARWSVDLAFKFAQPFATFIIVLFGVPFAAFRRRGGLVLGFGLSLLVCFVYFGFQQVGKILGYGGELSPFWAAWIGNIVFGFIGLALVWRAPK